MRTRLGPGSPTYTSLQASRFCAAGVVVLFHLNVVGQANGSAVFRFLDFGYLGVDFFFVLSGFVIVHSHWHDIGKPPAVGRFLRKRLLRIYPPYLIVVCASLLLGIVLPTSYHVGTWTYVVANLALLPTPQNNVMLVAWSLQQEILFYLIFCLIILNRELGSVALLVFVGSAGIAGPAARFPFSFLFSLHHLQFGLGMLGAYLSRKITLTQPGVSFICGLVAFAAVACVDVLWLNGGVNRQLKDLLDLPAGVVSLLLILSMVSLESSRWRRVPPLLVSLGDASYALYLVHVPVISIGSRLFQLHGLSKTPIVIKMTVLFVCSNLVAIGFHFYIERPLGRWLRRRTVSGQHSKVVIDKPSVLCAEPAPRSTPEQSGSFDHR